MKNCVQVLIHKDRGGHRNAKLKYCANFTFFKDVLRITNYWSISWLKLCQYRTVIEAILLQSLKNGDVSAKKKKKKTPRGARSFFDK